MSSFLFRFSSPCKKGSESAVVIVNNKNSKFFAKRTLFEYLNVGSAPTFCYLTIIAYIKSI